MLTLCVAGLVLLVLLPTSRSSGILLVSSLILSFAAMELAPLPLPRGERYRLDAGVAVAAMLLLDPVTAGLVAFTGSALGASFVHWGSTRGHDIADVVRTGGSVYAVSALWSYAGLATGVEPALLSSWANALGLGLVYMTVDLVGWTTLESRMPGSRITRSLGSLLALLGSLYLGHISAGVAMAVVERSLGVLAILSLVMLILIMQHTFGLLLRVRAAYTMTVSALSRVAEMSQDSTPGHGERVAETAAALGRTMGLSSAGLERLTLAALLHDIGGIRDEPVASRSARAAERQKASIGATLLSRVNFLSSLAPIIARHANPYAEYIETHDTDGLMARVVHVASDFDRLTTDEGCDHREAFERLNRLRGREYEPRILDALEAHIRSGR